MNYVFYKSISNKHSPILNNKSEIIDIRRMFKNIINIENELPKKIRKTLSIMRSTLKCKQLPFTLISEDMFRKLQNYRDLNDSFFIIPHDVDYIYEFSINDSSPEVEGINMDSDNELPDFKGDAQRNGYPRTVNNGEEIMEFFHLLKFKDKERGKRYFLFIRNWKRKTSAIFNKYNSRIYEIKSNMIDNELNDFTYKKIPLIETDKPVAVIVHGFMSYTEENFIALKKTLLESNEYSQIFGYSYPPNKVGIRDNGLGFLKILTDTGLLYSNRKIDLYAHSEGGLVCKSMIARDLRFASAELNIRHLITAGTPHLGTPIAKLGLKLFSLPQLAIYVSNTFINSFFNGTSLQSIKILEKLILLNYMSRTRNLGLKDMVPNSEFLNDLQKRCKDNEFKISGSIILASYELKDYNTSMPVSKLLDALNNLFKGEKHDGVVPKKSSEYLFTESKPIVLVDETEGCHSEYYGNIIKAKNIVNTVVSLEKVPTTL